jgi:hypothetical protein
MYQNPLLQILDPPLYVYLWQVKVCVLIIFCDRLCSEKI